MTTALALVGWLVGVLCLAVTPAVVSQRPNVSPRAEDALFGLALAVLVVGSVAGGALLL